MAGGESKVARPQETPTKKSRRRKPQKSSSGLFKARALEPLELEPKVLDKVQISPVPSQGDSVLNSMEGESLQVPSKALLVVSPQDASSLCQAFWKR